MPASPSTHRTPHPLLALLALLATAALAVNAASCAGAAKPTGAVPVQVAQAPAAEPVPTAQLGRNVVPTHYTLELGIVPTLERFNGRVTIAATVAKPTQRIYLHGLDLTVSEVTATVGQAGGAQPVQQTLTGRYTQLDEHGLAAVDFDSPLPAGAVTLRFSYDAPFGTQLRGLYRVKAEGNDYAFTQFEATSARTAFPCFDEPAFKTPFDVWLTVPEAQTGISNGPQLTAEVVAAGYKRLHFKPTQPLPTYLVAFAVGPFDVVEAPALAANAVRSRPVPMRGVAIKGKGPQLAYALSQTPAMVAALEDYFGIPYPYDKLDLIAVPDFAAGAMENAGAITFREWLLLFDERTAVERQRRSFAYVMAHELSHQWFGNYVTMPWWDDIWLNEAFATWMGHRVIAELHPEYHADTSFLGYVQHAMDVDALLSARMVRQPVTSHDDIANAFDGITYSKGGGVLAMFERFLGEQPFRGGIRRYLSARPFGSATAEDLVAALVGDSVELRTAFASFLNQSGIPRIEAKLQCQPGDNRLTLTQTRYLPAGSVGTNDRLWFTPVCLRYEVDGQLASTCTLLDAAEKTITLPGEGCPRWYMPNADAAGYYRFSLPPADLAKLRTRGLGKLNTRELLSLASNLDAGLDGGYLAAGEVLSMLPALAESSEREVAQAPMALLPIVHDQLVSTATRPKVRRYARKLYDPLQRRLGWRARPGEDGEQRLLRASVMTFLADVAVYPRVRIKAAQLGRKYLGLGGDGKLHPEVVAADLAPLAVRIAVEDGDTATFEAALSAFTTAGDPVARGLLLRALSAVHDGRSGRALGLALNPALRVNEVLIPLRSQLGDERTREAAWRWFVENFDAIAARVSPRNMGHTPWMSTGFCSTLHAQRLQTFFEPRLEQLTGGPRALAGAVEALGLCEARKQRQGPAAEAFFRAR